VLRRAQGAMTAREIMLALLDGKTPEATRKQEMDRYTGSHPSSHA
jgi:hypothetical protein